jgi:predicted phosphoribosyltransferase
MKPLFHSRVDAAAQLARALYRYRGRNPLVLAIPRGAVQMGAVIAEALEGELAVGAPADAAGRVAIVIDDGVATGASMIAALRAVRAKSPARLVCAVPVAPVESLEAIQPCADEVVCLHTPRELCAIGRFYQEFPQIEDAEVVKLLARAHRKPTHPA